MTRKEAIKKVRWGLLGLVIDKDVRDAFETLIPELAESEDERIRKKLIETIGYFRSRGINQQLCDEFIAYLEKQKEQKPEERFAEAREKYQVEWSEEDEKMNKEIRLYLKQDRTEFPGRADRINKMIEWLINIYPQPQPNMSISFMLYLDEIRQEGKMCLSNEECADIEDAFNKQDWPRLFKYINKYRPSWKPSEEQMNLLLNIEGILRKRNQPVKATQLAELYEQLKKLM